MMRSLDLRLGFRPARPGDMDRLLELTQRTNQFNTTTKRRSAADIRSILSSDTQKIYVASLADRFGSLGVVAAAIVERRPEQEVVFDSVIMSCRAMGFGLEQALLRKVIDQEPGQTYIGLFEPTPRNSPAAALFENSGFTPGGASRWTLQDRLAVPPVPDWFSEDA
jgi:FkbH-like protein